MSATMELIPKWLKGELFEKLLKSRFEGFKSILSFNAEHGLKPGENYSTIMLRLHFKVELIDSTTPKCVTYMLKTPHEFQMYRDLLQKNNMFAIEREVFLKIVPELEQMYRNVGLEVKFTAQAYKIAAPDECVLLEDLRARGFKNADRLAGLDEQHTLCVLKKLAQWHAASATRVLLKGPYDQKYTKGAFTEPMSEDLHKIMNSLGKYLLDCMPQYKDQDSYINAVHQIQSRIIELMYGLGSVDDTEFNVLNHGDCWTNNIMFQYESAASAPSETYFVDLQMPKYGTVALDLLYFVLTSTQLELKLNRFDYYIRYYHGQLIAHLKLLEYPTEKQPSLCHLHLLLLKYGFIGYYTVLMACPPILLDRSDDGKANLNDFVNETDKSDSLKMLMYSNARYCSHVNAILLWLNNRGALQV